MLEVQDLLDEPSFIEQLSNVDPILLDKTMQIFFDLTKRAIKEVEPSLLKKHNIDSIELDQMSSFCQNLICNIALQAIQKNIINKETILKFEL